MLKLKAYTSHIDVTPDHTVAFFTTEEDIKKNNIRVPENIVRVIHDINFSGFKAKKGKSLFVPLKTNPRIIIIGLGKNRNISIEDVRNAASAIAIECKTHAVSSVHIIPPEITGHDSITIEKAVAEGVYLANYDFNTYKTKKEDANSLLKEVILHSHDKNKCASALKETATICENVLQCRNMINETSDNTTPELIARRAKKLSSLKNVNCKVYDKKEIEKMGMGLITAVGRGSSNPPKLVILKYKGDPGSKKWTALVGKGITFDSGGMNLKPSKSIEDMRMDMAGAAASMYTLKTVAELGMKKNIMAVLPLSENMVSGTSYKPGDVFRAYNGKTVEIGNTDAEGRLILADALAFTEDKLKPSMIIDMAT